MKKIATTIIMMIIMTMIATVAWATTGTVNTKDLNMREGASTSKNVIKQLAKGTEVNILSEEGNEKILGKPVGNDKEHGKCTYVSKYGLEGAKEILNKITKEAIEIINCYGEKGEFLKELALYIANRNK
jgi:hypothetical protein